MQKSKISRKAAYALEKRDKERTKKRDWDGEKLNAKNKATKKTKDND